MPYPKQSNFLRSLHILLITITTHPIIFGFNIQIIDVFLLFSRLLKNFYYPRSLKDQIKPLFPRTFWFGFLVEVDGIEPTTPCLQSRCSPSWAKPPFPWWVWLVSNQRPPRYQHGALTNWATDPFGSVSPLSAHTDLMSLFTTDDKCERLHQGFSLERRWSSRTFRYGYLVTTSPQSRILPW